MRRVAALTILGLTTVMTSTCKPRQDVSAVRDVDVTQHPWLISPMEVGPDTPPAGRSALEYLLPVKQGANGPEYDIPDTFQGLVKLIEERSIRTRRTTDRPRVLIPFGRSLQRKTTDAKDPRVVLTMEMEPCQAWQDVSTCEGAENELGINLKNRIFLGFARRAELAEVISFNEKAGRFEFQIIEDLAPGKKPQLKYASRTLCVACHQNGSPIFPVDNWKETFANRPVVQQMHEAMRNEREYEGILVDQNRTASFRFDTATDMAAFLTPTQRLWTEECDANPAYQGDTCRRDVLQSAFQYLLSEELDRSGDTYKRLADHWRTLRSGKWSRGIAMPNPDLLNRDPFRERGNAGGGNIGELISGRDRERLMDAISGSDIPAAFEPTVPRAPLPGVRDVERSHLRDKVHEWQIRNTAEIFTQADARMLDAALRRHAGEAPEVVATQECWWTPESSPICEDRRHPVEVYCFTEAPGEGGGEIHFEGCLPSLPDSPTQNLEGVSGRLTYVTPGLPDEEIPVFNFEADAVEDGGNLVMRLRDMVLVHSGVSLRRGTGNLIAGVTIRIPTAATMDEAMAGQLTERQDFAMAMTRLDAAGLFSARPLQRGPAMQAALSAAGVAAADLPAACCGSEEGMPPIVLEEEGGGDNPPDPEEQTDDVVIARDFYESCKPCHSTQAELKFLDPPPGAEAVVATLKRALTREADGDPTWAKRICERMDWRRVSQAEVMPPVTSQAYRMMKADEENGGTRRRDMLQFACELAR